MAAHYSFTPGPPGLTVPNSLNCPPRGNSWTCITTPARTTTHAVTRATQEK